MFSLLKKLCNTDKVNKEGKPDTAQDVGANKSSELPIYRAEGYDTESYGIYSHSEGFKTQAEGDYSHAEGNDTLADGAYSHAEGLESQALSEGSHAEGDSTVAKCLFAHAEGLKTIAEGISSHSEGNFTKANGDASHAEGEMTYAYGFYSHAEGTNTKAFGMASHSEGYMTVANNVFEHASGSFNVSNKGSNPSDQTRFSVGIGEWGLKKNSIEIMRNGDTYIIGIGNYDGRNFENASDIQQVIQGMQTEINSLKTKLEEIDKNIKSERDENIR